MVDRSGWSHDWQRGWSHEAGNTSAQVVPCGWQATSAEDPVAGRATWRRKAATSCRSITTSTARPCYSGRERPSSWRADFTGLLEAMDALPLTVRLLNPPLHEFPRDRAGSWSALSAEERGETVDDDVHLLAAVNRLSEPNTILGLRGVRLGLVVPGLFPLLELTQ